MYPFPNIVQMLIMILILTNLLIIYITKTKLDAINNSKTNIIKVIDAAATIKIFFKIRLTRDVFAEVESVFKNQVYIAINLVLYHQIII